MTAALNPDQVLALAPDAASVKSGRDLAAPAKWQELGRGDTVAWGACQGSAAELYRASVTLDGAALRCTCPSRKRPCKHALGLLLLVLSRPEVFASTAPPAWAAPSVPKAPVTTPPAAQPSARTLAARESKVTAGVDELNRWLGDLVRRGIAGAHGQPYRYWDVPAARLVDAQAPGLARMVRDLAGIPASGEGWHERLLARLGSLALLLQAYQRLEALPPDLQAEVHNLVGRPRRQEEAMAAPPVRDRWTVLGATIEEEDRLRVRRTWLVGQSSGRAALLLDFAHGKAAFAATYLPGAGLDADLGFFPAAVPLRAVVQTLRAATPAPGPAGHTLIEAALTAYAEALARNPWLERYPLILSRVIPVPWGPRWAVRDSAEVCLPLRPACSEGWRLAAISGGHPLTLAGEWDGASLLPLGAWTDAGYRPL